MAQSQSVAQGRRPGRRTAYPTSNSGRSALGSIGVVYGDIGTSPLYAFREAVHAAKATSFAGPEAVLGVLSLIIWTLLLIVTLKYVLVLLNADNKGEGGTFALMALGQSVAKRSAPADPGARRGRRRLLLRRRRHHAGHLGAVGGRGPEARRAGLRGCSCCRSRSSSSSALFAVQSRGTAQVAQFFGPIMLVWFVVARRRRADPHRRRPATCFLALNPVLRRPVRPHARRRSVSPSWAWSSWSSPAPRRSTPISATSAASRSRSPGSRSCCRRCILNYFGQGALLLANPEAIENPFYRLYPELGADPDGGAGDARHRHRQPGGDHRRLLASRARPFSSGCCRASASATRPRAWPGQIYLPRVNQLLFVGVLLVALIFRSSSDLAAAYGVVGDGDHGDRQPDGVLRGVALLELAGVEGGAADGAAAVDRAGLPRRQHPEDSRGRLAAAVCGRHDRPHHGADLGARLARCSPSNAQERGRSRMAGAQARCQAAASRARHGRVPDRRSDRRADLADAQSQAQPRAARAQHHPHHQDRGHAARAAPRAHRRSIASPTPSSA